MRRASVASLAALLLAACATTWQSEEAVQAQSYAAAGDRVPRYAGKLRRLVLLAPVVEPAGEQCAREYPGEAARWVEEEARAYLTDWKGYVPLAAQDAPLARALGPWQASSPQARRPPEALAAQLRSLAVAHAADGVLVLHAAPECIDTLDIVLNVLVIGMPNFYSKALGRDFSAGLYDATGALVWQSYAGLGPLDATAASRSRENAVRAVEGLLGLLENAIPEILAR